MRLRASQTAHFSEPERTPHLVIDVRAFVPHRDGISSYILGLVPRLMKLTEGWKVTTIANPLTTEVVRSWGGSVVIDSSRPMWPRQNITIPLLIRKLRADVFFYPAYDPPLGPIPCPLVLTVHDLSPLLFRPYFETLDPLKTAYVRAVTNVAIRRAARVLAVSESTMQTVSEVFGETAGRKTRVIHNGTETPIAGSSGADAHFLYLGTDRPHKNLARLIDAYALARGLVQHLPPLVLAGGFRDRPAVEHRLSAAGIAPSTRIMGHVSDDQADLLLRDAIAVVVPSLAEGFGMPILEAMARGVPVITSDRSACKEVAGDAALLVDPYSSLSIGRAIAQVSADAGLRASLSQKGLARAATFSWDRAARQSLSEIRWVLHPSSSGSARGSRSGGS